jgi:hypothetical protein
MAVTCRPAPVRCRDGGALLNDDRIGQDWHVPKHPEPGDHGWDPWLVAVENFLEGNRELVNGIVAQLITTGRCEYQDDSGHLLLVARSHRWRTQWYEHQWTSPDGRRGSGRRRLDRDAFVPPCSSLALYVAADLVEMRGGSG